MGENPRFSATETADGGLVAAGVTTGLTKVTKNPGDDNGFDFDQDVYLLKLGPETSVK